MIKIVDLGMHPFADTFIGADQLHLSEPAYPLECFLNKETGEIKLGTQTQAHDRYTSYNYSYTSSNSKFSRNHWDEYSKSVSSKIKLPKNSQIVEVGSNDGYLSRQFKNLGYKVLGIDPSQYMADLALKEGVETHVDLFCLKSSEIIKERLGKVDLIVANNVFNHTNDVHDFTSAVSSLLKDDGTFVYELPYWYNTIKDQRFDQIYHEHVTYFTAKFSYQLLKAHGFQIVDIEVVNYHGGSLRVFAKKTRSTKLANCLKKLIDQEKSLGLFEENTYKNFMDALHTKRNLFLKQICDLRLKSIPVIGVGAAAKGNTFLNFYNLDNSMLDYVTDSSPHKQGKYTPLTRIPIVGDEIFAEYSDVYALILSWNIANSLKNALHSINNKIKFLELPK